MRTLELPREVCRGYWRPDAWQVPQFGLWRRRWCGVFLVVNLVGGCDRGRICCCARRFLGSVSNRDMQVLLLWQKGGIKQE